MKHRLQTLLKHKLQWLLLLAALLGVSQGVWGYSLYLHSSSSSIYGYGWGNSEYLGSWPGKQFSNTTYFKSLGNNWYKLKSSLSNTNSLKVNDGSGNQSNELQNFTQTVFVNVSSATSISYYHGLTSYDVRGSFNDWTEGSTFTGFDDDYAAYKYTTTISAGTITFKYVYSNSEWRNNFNNTRGNVTLSHTGDNNNITFTLSVESEVSFYYDPAQDYVFVRATPSCTAPDADNFSVTGNSLTYNGTAQSATVESSDTDVYDPESITVKYGAASASATATQTNAGTYNIYVTAASSSGDYCAVTSAIELDDDLTIAPVTPTDDNKATLFTITGVPASVTFNEESHAASVAWKSPYSCTGALTIYYKKGSDDATTTAPVNVGTYAVTLSVAAGTNNAASESDISLGNIVINKASQATVSIDNDGNYCVGSSVTAHATGGSGTGSYSFTRVSGTSGITINSSTGAITAANAGTITVTATRAADDNYNVSSASSSVTFTFYDAPTAYTLSAGGESESTICSAGGTLTLSGSQSGYSYQVKKDGVSAGSAKAGTGSALEFTVYESGEYTCEAYLTGSPDCKTNMTGTVTLHMSLTPNLMPATPTVKNYEPVTITSINTEIESWTITDAGNTAYLYNQTSSSVTVKASKANSPYTVTATTRGGCSSTVTVTVVDDTEACGS